MWGGGGRRDESKKSGASSNTIDSTTGLYCTNAPSNFFVFFSTLKSHVLRLQLVKSYLKRSRRGKNLKVQRKKCLLSKQSIEIKLKGKIDSVTLLYFVDVFSQNSCECGQGSGIIYGTKMVSKVISKDSTCDRDRWGRGTLQIEIYILKLPEWRVEVHMV